MEEDGSDEAEVLGGIAYPTGGQVLSSLERAVAALSKVRVASSCSAEQEENSVEQGVEVMCSLQELALTQ